MKTLVTLQIAILIILVSLAYQQQQLKRNRIAQSVEFMILNHKLDRIDAEQLKALD